MAGADGGGRGLQTDEEETDQGPTTGGTDRDLMTAEIVQGPTTGGTIDRGPTTGGTTTESNDQFDQIPEGYPQELRPAVNLIKTAGARPAEPEMIEP